MQASDTGKLHRGRQKVIEIVVVVIAVLAIASWLVPTILSPCSNEIQSQKVSPDGSLRAVVFERNCGATTGSNAQVSVLPQQSSLPNEAGNTFIEDDDNGEAKSLRVEVNWLGARRLSITHDAKARLFLSKDSVTVNTGLLLNERVAIVYGALNEVK